MNITNINWLQVSSLCNWKTLRQDTGGMSIRSLPLLYDIDIARPRFLYLNIKIAVDLYVEPFRKDWIKGLSGTVWYYALESRGFYVFLRDDIRSCDEIKGPHSFRGVLGSSFHRGIPGNCEVIIDGNIMTVGKQFVNDSSWCWAYGQCT